MGASVTATSEYNATKPKMAVTKSHVTHELHMHQMVTIIRKEITKRRLEWGSNNFESQQFYLVCLVLLKYCNAVVSNKTHFENKSITAVCI